MILISSCAIHRGSIQNSASLSTNNFTYVKRNAKGTARAFYPFGIGGFSTQSLIDKAKREMLIDNPLANNQTLANITVNEKRGIYVFIIIVDVTITADVVEFK